MSLWRGGLGDRALVAGGTPLCILYFMEGQGARLKAARIAAGFGDATAAARRFGWTVPTCLAHENGSRGFEVERAQAYAAAFKANASWVLTGKGHPAPTVKLRIRGYVGVGGQVYLFTDESPNFTGNEEVEIPAASIEVISRSRFVVTPIILRTATTRSFSYARTASEFLQR